MTHIRFLASALGLLLVAAILESSAAGQCVQGACEPAVKPHAAVVRVASASPGGSRCYGSGTLVHGDAEQGIVLTCAHLFREAQDNVWITFPDGRRLEADLLAADQAWDLAALKITEPQVAPVTIADDHPKPGDALQSCGYGSDGRFWCNRGRALGYARTAATKTYETLELSGHARDGDSGGPVLNASGELVAVLWGTDGRMVGGTYCGRIRKFLHGILPLRFAAEYQPIPARGWTWTDDSSIPAPDDLNLVKLIPVTEHHLTWHQVINPPWQEMHALQGKANAGEFLGCPEATLLFEGVEASKLYRAGLETGPSEFCWQVHYVFRERSVKHGGQVYGWNHFYREKPAGWYEVTNGTHRLYDLADFSTLFQSAVPT